jgi:septal ring factor EnvC (AmiA/AmiB activator)
MGLYAPRTKIAKLDVLLDVLAEKMNDQMEKAEEQEKQMRKELEEKILDELDLLNLSKQIDRLKTRLEILQQEFDSRNYYERYTTLVEHTFSKRWSKNRSPVPIVEKRFHNYCERLKVAYAAGDAKELFETIMKELK